MSHRIRVPVVNRNALTLFENLAFASWFVLMIDSMAALFGNLQLALYGLVVMVFLAQAAGISKCCGIRHHPVRGLLFGSLGPLGLLLLPAVEAQD